MSDLPRLGKNYLNIIKTTNNEIFLSLINKLLLITN